MDDRRRRDTLAAGDRWSVRYRAHLRWMAAAGALLLLLAVVPGASARAVAGTPRCFGAAARDPARPPCDNPRLRLSVVPTPRDAPLTAGPPCKRLAADRLIIPCAFGARPGDAQGRFALVGDSHAAHWRSALLAVARRQHWRGYALTRFSCAFTSAGRPLPEPFFSECVDWKRQLPEWLTRHPFVSTIFLAQIVGDAGNFPADAPESFEAKVAGYVDAWKRLPNSVKHIFVIRDNPSIHYDTLACVSTWLARRRPPGPACAVSREGALPPDPAVAAAAQLGTERFHVVDLTPFFCDERNCYPVVGGVLVYKDINHITPLFAETLAPILLRYVRAQTCSGPPGTGC